MNQMMDENQMFSLQIMGELNQNPILKNMVNSLMFNSFLIEKMINILTILKYNPLVRDQIKSYLIQLSPLDFQGMNQNLMMNINQMGVPNYDISNQMMNQDSMNKPENNEDCVKDKTMAIIFRVSGNKEYNEIISVICNSNEKVSELIEKYRIKNNDKRLNIKFIYNAKSLNDSLTLKEAQLMNNSNVFVVPIHQIRA
jgi:hypothetical protein